MLAANAGWKLRKLICKACSITSMYASHAWVLKHVHRVCNTIHNRLSMHLVLPATQRNLWTRLPVILNALAGA